MKKNEIYLVVAASMLVVAGWAAWRFTAIDKLAEPLNNASLPVQQTTPGTPKTAPVTALRTTGKPTNSETTEKVEILKKRISEGMSRTQASLDTMRAGPKATLKASRDRNKPEDMAFLKSLGLSDDLRDKVYDMLTAKADLYWVHEEKIKEAPQERESYAGYISELRQKGAEIEATVGTENYAKIKYWQTTELARLEVAKFKNYLQSRSLPLTEQQEASVVDAMHQARGGNVGYSLTSPSISMEDKLAYMNTVKQSLALVLNANDLALLEQHMKEVADQASKMQAHSEALKKKVEDLKKRPSNPPAPPR